MARESLSGWRHFRRVKGSFQERERVISRNRKRHLRKERHFRKQRETLQEVKRSISFGGKERAILRNRRKHFRKDKGFQERKHFRRNVYLKR